MDKRHIILSVLLTLPFLGIEVSPVGSNSWVTSITIWAFWLVLLSVYNRHMILKLIPIRLRSPLYIVGNNPAKKITNGRALSDPIRLEYDNVLWEDIGRRGRLQGEIIVKGPLCPKDFTPLSIRRGSNIETRFDDDRFISEYHGYLYCITCKGKYLLAARSKSKQIVKSRDEVRVLFEGKRAREFSNSNNH